MLDIHKIYSDTINNGGMTTNLLGITPDRGYLVGTVGNEMKEALDDFSPSTIVKYLSAHRSQIRGNNYFGIWIDDGYVYLDISQLVIGYTKALDKGLANNQLAIYDCEHKAVIEIQRRIS